MRMQTYPATPYLRQLTAENGWRGRLVRDRHGRADLIVAVRVGLTWTDSVAIEAEDRCVALRHRTHEGRLVLPIELPSESRAVWQRAGRCEDVLAELLELTAQRYDKVTLQRYCGTGQWGTTVSSQRLPGARVSRASAVSKPQPRNSASAT
jgi:hypothetical protein